MKKIFYLPVFIFLYIYCLGTSFALSGEVLSGTTSKKTIRELKQDIDNLKTKKDTLKNQWDIFVKENGKITTFIRNNLFKEEKISLENILENYYTEKNKIELEIFKRVNKIEDTTKLRKELLSKKIKLYKALVPYIDKIKIKDYLSYIKSNIKLFEKNKIVKEEIYKGEKQLRDKVSFLKGKIEENNRKLNEKIKILVENRLKNKIDKIKENPRFKLLTLEKKKELFQITLKKLKTKREELEAIENKLTIIEKKIEIYKIAIEIVKETIEKLE